ncbi:uncharacterized protein LOC142777293 [Rhipicephalus microplus]|uniref:uncharacterized protein LOC142777293 n=1 Tax=Rhipicephalus microplus TaxID=6941 RepID=UPI003F6CCBEB
MAKETTGPNKVALIRKGKLVVMVVVVQRFYGTALLHYIQVKDTPSSAGGSHQLQLCHDLTDESISLELDESTDDQQGELLRATVEEECQHKEAATSCSTISTEKFPSLLHRAVGPSARVCFWVVSTQCP